MGHTARQELAYLTGELPQNLRFCILNEIEVAVDLLYWYSFMVSCLIIVQVKAAIGGPVSEYAGWATYRFAICCCILIP